MDTLYIDGAERKVMRITENQLRELVFALSEKILATSLKFDKLVFVLRGAAIPARYLSDRLGIGDMSSIWIEKYGDKIGSDTGGEVQIKEDLNTDLSGLNVLGFDEVCESGDTIRLLKERLEKGNRGKLGAGEGRPRCVKTAALVIKEHTSFKPDFYALKTDRWCFFPGDEMEVIRKVEESYKQISDDFSDEMLVQKVNPYFDEETIKCYLRLRDTVRYKK